MLGKKISIIFCVAVFCATAAVLHADPEFGGFGGNNGSEGSSGNGGGSSGGSGNGGSSGSNSDTD